MPGLSGYTSGTRSRNRQRLDSEYSNVLLDGTAPMSSSSRQIMSTSQKRLLGAQGQGYTAPRPEDDTISTVKPQLYEGGLQLPSGQKYNGYTAPGGKFFMNGLAPGKNLAGQDVAAGIGMHAGNVPGVMLPNQAVNPKAEQMAMRHRQAEALRAQQWVDPGVNAQVQAMGLQHPASQQMLGQMFQRNAQIPWAQEALGQGLGGMAGQKQIQQAMQQQHLANMATKNATVNDLHDELMNIEKGIASKSSIWKALTGLFNTDDQKASFLRAKIKELGGAAAPAAPGLQPPAAQARPVQQGGGLSPINPYRQQVAPLREEGGPIQNWDSQSRRGTRQMDFVERLQRMDPNQRMEVAQMVNSGIPAEQAVEQLTAGQYAPPEPPQVGMGQNVARVSRAAVPQGLRQPKQRTWSQYFGMA